uniref:Uncharacterized protein n=1 Tax=Lepeophtheirus salmonis TaxID=72036 RepID=A0A0K2ULE3_LEPSM
MIDLNDLTACSAKPLRIMR